MIYLTVICEDALSGLKWPYVDLFRFITQQQLYPYDEDPP